MRARIPAGNRWSSRSKWRGPCGARAYELCAERGGIFPLKVPASKAAASPQKQLDSLLAKFRPEIARLGRGAIVKMRKRLPNAIELVYDNYNALVIGFGPTERPSDAIFSIVLYPRRANLFFLQGAKLPDPGKRLQGSAAVARHVVLEGIAALDDPEISELMVEALRRAKVSMNPAQRRRLVIRSISAKQRPRRPA